MLSAGPCRRSSRYASAHPLARRIEAFRDFASRLPETLDVFVVTGPEDFLIHVSVPDTDALYAFVIDRLTERPEVADVRTLDRFRASASAHP